MKNFRSTPKDDEAYGGEDDLTAAYGYEDADGTTIVFRRKMRASHPSDHDLDDNMHVIWAAGQKNGKTLK